MLRNNEDAWPVLVVDDHPDVRLALRVLLRSEGLSSVEVGTAEAAIDAVSRQDFSCAVLDLNYGADTTSGNEGLDLVARIRMETPDLPIIAMTAWGSIGLAVRAMRIGAADFIEKPWNNAHMIHTVRAQIALRSMFDENRRLRAEALLSRQPGDMLRVCESSAMRHVVDLIRRIASGDANVLILGENGTGKSLFAREIHLLSPRTDFPVIRVDMSTLPDSRFAEEMFGEEKPQPYPGKFELAHRGSLIMEEIGAIHPAQQAKLLRVVEEGELERGGTMRTRRVDVRVISTTNIDLDTAVRTDRFRRDLLYRLNAMQVRLPPLRERPEDIVPLARHFLLRECKRMARGAMTLAPSAERALRSYDWPGNVRELEHAIERAILLAGHDQIDAESLSLHRRTDLAVVLDSLTLPEAEELLIRHALERNDHNLQRAADALGISRQALYRRLEKHRARAGFEHIG
ncbi:sigma-54-dependent transcriptional regulator [Luteibacter sp. UNCMF366Tsu5.1]|uniref:sigma-54-dependent transcriptional regulator n=1 Tax=Luteibacter sp. UNCMF366Tsu5.1 TaxID=1502758 RepID=UPI0009091E02|nr:sigma-54 dependent transcriptional regulator [Luteibacter sp. UNCMF366Tsu5.1]SFW70363.1 DNA-binding transcriptional response regulator, NtrC family, contains REC, AAA-type ATPase, and a Fis-type DNA-binding domains [Luteibacter sp. UNCMF366Tsu5.1]